MSKCLVYTLPFVLALVSACDGSSSEDNETNNPNPFPGSVASLEVNSRGYADVVIDSFNNNESAIEWPYGRDAEDTSVNQPVELSIILGPPSEIRNGNTQGVEFLSIPRGNYVTVGFVDEIVVDGEGPDLEIVSIDDHASETANLYIGTDVDSLFLAGVIGEGGTEAIDFASIGYDGKVSVVRIEALDNRGSAPGFDLMAVQAVNFESVTEQNQ